MATECRFIGPLGTRPPPAFHTDEVFLGLGVHVSASGNSFLTTRREVFYAVRSAGRGVTQANQWVMCFAPDDSAPQVMGDSGPAPR
jgi:hypothetical protein